MEHAFLRHSCRLTHRPADVPRHPTSSSTSSTNLPVPTLRYGTLQEYTTHDFDFVPSCVRALAESKPPICVGKAPSWVFPSFLLFSCVWHEDWVSISSYPSILNTRCSSQLLKD
ncbi:hypothetical protein MPTK1_8g18750 [Marchantia polymorpha subsp. ruderalis]|uniref:Uncharacterized protein n=1 Tax=Marchantia polymorpha TaxID=3197 RepID=A0A2R6W852_MARPO|nr:hypothetical protein MARPO_0131s0028 [Marchantia polymorpha]BBN20394.1 hypothetical protein Mp_8g18750 [Marchantia polymorpha subsp. ruderalis]|eukprot:PTQ30033.1 hypothetical protein MARPO_0131s0028 [Marchantia polymorpha]